MRAVGMIVIKVGLEKTPEMPLVQYDDMVEHFTPDTADESLDVWVLLWTAGGDQHPVWLKISAVSSSLGCSGWVYTGPNHLVMPPT